MIFLEEPFKLKKQKTKQKTLVNISNFSMIKFLN